MSVFDMESSKFIILEVGLDRIPRMQVKDGAIKMKSRNLSGSAVMQNKHK